MEDGLPEENSEEAREGKELHTFQAHPEYDRSVLKPKMQELLKIADQLDQKLFDTVIENEKLLDSDEYAERREVASFRADLFAGHIDLVRRYLKRGITIIRDSKFGYAPVERAEMNLQLRGYAALSDDETVYVAIVQPRAPYGQRITIAKYTAANIRDSRDQIAAIIDACSFPDAQLHAGDWCRYCRARSMCPELMRSVQNGLVPFDLMPEDLSKPAKLGRVEARLAQISDVDLGKMLAAYSLVQFVHEPMMEEARRRINAGQLEGWKLSKAIERRKIVDSQRAIALLSLAGMARDDIMECVNLSLTKLEDKLDHGKLRLGQVIAGSKDAKQFTNRVLSSVIETEVVKPRVLKNGR